MVSTRYPNSSVSSMSMSEVDRQTLRHRVRARIEKAILTGELTQGQRLHESKLAGEMGVSRGLVREAMRELGRCGFVETIPYRGSFVREWTAERAMELYTLRSKLEEFATELAVQRITEEQTEELAELVDAMRREARMGNAEQIAELDVLFHKRLVEFSGHQLLIETLESISVQTHIFIMATKAFYPVLPTLDAVADSHECLLNAMRTGNPETARAAMAGHIQTVGEQYVESLTTRQNGKS